MKIYLLIFILFGFNFAFSQENEEEKETVQVRKKIEFSIYKGVLQETKDWYIVVDSETKYYLINVSIPEDEIVTWFKRFKDSQNIYTSFLGNIAYPVLNFRKENDPSEYLTFYLNQQNNDYISLTLIETNTLYKFILIEKFSN
jgi:hypothetical protein